MVLLEPVKQNRHSQQEHLSHSSWKALELAPISFVQQGSSMERRRMSEVTISLVLSKPAIPLGNQSEGRGGKRHFQLLCFKILLPSEKLGVTRPASFQIIYPDVTYSQEHCRTSTSLLSPPQATCSAECTHKPAHVEQKEPELQDTGGDGSSATVLGYTCIHGSCRTPIFVLCHINELLERLPLLCP